MKLKRVQEVATVFLQKKEIFLFGLWILAGFLGGGQYIRGMPLPVAPALTSQTRIRGKSLFLLSLWGGALWGLGISPVLISYVGATLSVKVWDFLWGGERKKVWGALIPFTPVLGFFRLYLTPLPLEWPLLGFYFLGEIGLYALFLFLGKESEKKEERVPILPLALIFLGLARFPVAPLTLLIPAGGILFLASLRQYWLGMGAGVALGTFRVLVGSGGAYEMGFLPLLALVASLLRHQSYGLYGLAFLGITLIFSDLIPFVRPGEYLQIYILVPGMALLSLYLSRNFQLGQEELMTHTPAKIEQMNSMVDEKVENMAEVLQVMADTFRERDTEEGILHEEFTEEIMHTLSRGLCARCPRHGDCWDRRYRETYALFQKIFSRAPQENHIEAQELWKIFGHHCIDGSRMLASLQEALSSFRLHYFWQREIREQQDLLARQMDEMGIILKNLGLQIRTAWEENWHKEEQIATLLQQKGYGVERVSLHREKNMFRIELFLHPCSGKNRCLHQILPLLKRELGCNLALQVRSCGFSHDQKCSLNLIPRRMYSMDTGMVAVSSSWNDVSGDRFSVHEMGEGQFVAMLSDGMGTGEKAARESNVTISLLERILTAGFSYDLAVQAVNTALNIRGQGDMYATMDLVLFDTFSGRTMIAKVGSAQSYVQREGEVFILQGDRPPLGIMNRVQASTWELYLGKGDSLLLTSDGVEITEQTADILQQGLMDRRLSIRAQTKAEDLLARIGGNGRKTGDDVTLLLLQVQGRS